MKAKKFIKKTIMVLLFGLFSLFLFSCNKLSKQKVIFNLCLEDKDKRKKEIQVASGDKVLKSQIPKIEEREGFLFRGWKLNNKKVNPEEVVIVENTEFIANWEKQWFFKVRIHENSQDIITLDTTKMTDENKKLFQNEGYAIFPTNQEIDFIIKKIPDGHEITEIKAGNLMADFDVDNMRGHFYLNRDVTIQAKTKVNQQFKLVYEFDEALKDDFYCSIKSGNSVNYGIEITFRIKDKSRRRKPFVKINGKEVKDFPEKPEFENKMPDGKGGIKTEKWYVYDFIIKEDTKISFEYVKKS